MEGVVKPGSIKEPDRLFNQLAKDIGAKFKEVGIDLGLTFRDLQNELETGHYMMVPADQRAAKMLYLWQDATPEEDFTYSTLASALERSGFKRSAHKYCYMDSVPDPVSLSAFVPASRSAKQLTLEATGPTTLDPASRSAKQPTLEATGPTTLGWTFNLEKKRGLAIIVTCDYRGSNRALPTTNDDGDEMIKTLRDHFDYDVHTIKNEEATEATVKNMLLAVNHYLQNVFQGDNELNAGGRYKAIVFAFAGHGGSDRYTGDYIETVDGKFISVMADIVAAFMGKEGTLMKIPKLFFFDACRGEDWLTAALHRGARAAKKEVNYRIDYATIPEHIAPPKDKWMSLVAQLLREKDVSLADVMAEVKKTVYIDQNLFPQQPETRDRLVTGPLMLYHKK